MSRIRGFLVATVLSTFILAACSSIGDTVGGGAAQVPARREVARVADAQGKVEEFSAQYASGGGGSGGSVGSTTSGSASELDRMAIPQPAPARRGRHARQAAPLGIGPAVIKTADVSLRIERGDFREAVSEATRIAERYGGYVVSTTVDDQQQGSGAATLRLPADKFGPALSAVKDLGEVRQEQITGEDVTQEFIDLEARIRNLRAQERVLLKLMSQATSIVDTMRVQNHLTGVQLEIERLRGRLNYLDDQVAFSTIFVNMKEVGAPPAPKVGALQRAWSQAVDGFFGVLAAVIVAGGVVVPIALMVALAALGFKALRPWIARRMGASA